MRVLISGLCGFIGHHFAEHFVRLGWEVIGLDKLTYAGSMDRLRDTGIAQHVRVFTSDFTRPIPRNVIKEIGQVDAVIHLGAETHVDNSIKDPALFAETNILGTIHVMQAWPESRFFYFSTDEVFGPAANGFVFQNGHAHHPTNPYAASKSGAEMMVIAFGHTYRQKVTITRTMNVFGERQHNEKFIPLVISRVLSGERVLIHSDPTRTRAGSRFYIHARNVADAYRFLLSEAKPEALITPRHIVGEREIDNLQLAQSIAEIIGKPLNYELVDFHSSRPGHDLRYAMADNMKDIGWNMPKNFDESLAKTVNWYLEHPQWLA